tara:strand:+ start:355 stop:834 length:480 start_codon:yes stop_codon:yes gene_type:complete
MDNYKKFGFCLILVVLMTSCGFKVIDKSRISNFKIEKITTSGNKNINFLIKNSLYNNFSNNISDNILLIDFKSKKTKAIKEKNISNQITKYDISLNIDGKVTIVKNEIEKSFKINLNGSFNVSSNQSDTIDNQNNLEEFLADKASNIIKNKIINYINDL